MPSIKRIKSILNEVANIAFIKLKYSWRKRYKAGIVYYKGRYFKTPDIPSVVQQIEEIYILKYLETPNLLSKEHIIIDCGANVGVSSLFYSEMYPGSNIFSYEADPTIYEYLRENIKQAHNNNIHIFQKAIWVHNDTILFSQEGSASGSLKGTKNQINVNCQRLKDILNKFKAIDILKIDIEGAEYDVIQDCKESLSKINYIFLEYHSFSNETQKLSLLLDILQQNGFRYFLQEAYKPKIPRFSWLSKKQIMDLQLNIYAIQSNLITPD